ncbi:hypothetical protein QQF64_036401 [Cirrhinus molitorella]|uniref:Uncharacterized protein n=1 Tax=Cirrhinus molitorella TaxID=172907 RepID=A0ABR3NIG3_9TELE
MTPKRHLPRSLPQEILISTFGADHNLQQSSYTGQENEMIQYENVLPHLTSPVLAGGNPAEHWLLDQMMRVPQRRTKEKYALGIVTLFPALKDPLSAKGYEHFYDAQSGSGFLAWRIKTIQRKTKLECTKMKMQNTGGGGPTQERELPQTGDHLDEEYCKESISLMNHTTDQEIVKQKMKETFNYRQRLIHNSDESHTILTVFPRLLDTKGLIAQDFSLLFGPQTAAKLLEKWPTFYKEKHNDESPEVHQEWDSDTASLLLLLHILPPQPSKKKKLKISATQAMDHLVVFHKSITSLEDHLKKWRGIASHTSLPLELTSGALSNYYIVVDRMLIPCQGTTSLAAFDELFKAHFVFSVNYDDALSHMFTFLQTTVYGIDAETTKQSPKSDGAQSSQEDASEMDLDMENQPSTSRTSKNRQNICVHR